MIETVSNKHQVMSNGRRVWVNSPDGGSLARLSEFHGVAMIDIHKDSGDCFDCRHDLEGADAWDYFCRSLHNNFGVSVAECHRPDWVK